VEIKIMENKILVFDTAGIEPIRYSLKEGRIKLQELQDFYYTAKINVVTSYACASREFTYEHNSQQNIFVESITKDSCTLGDEGVVFLSFTGDFSQRPYGDINVPVSVINPQTKTTSTTNIDTLWKCTPQWNNEMSDEDKSLIEIIKDPEKENYALLTNNYHLREQCKFEGIKVYGTCSMLAGMVISNTMSYQKGTFIFNSWLEKDRKWIPNKNKERDKLSFKEILDIEKKRSRNNSSFWIN